MKGEKKIRKEVKTSICLATNEIGVGDTWPSPAYALKTRVLEPTGAHYAWTREHKRENIYLFYRILA
jgi:hypothetical protein